ncbi:hypothetical protein [Ruminococcus flavefaciens]|uniref:hypothetical protein n=1 Tax=Ruminococcus flavefaciens TaxID=1265 RepID=UPI0026F2567C|nr:hypothetical protein [Ruminococcus flavefaciens]
MLKKRAFSFAAALLMTVSAWSCGNTQPKAEPEEKTTAAETTEPATEAEKETSGKSGSKDGGIDLTFGMLGYVKKSKRSSANANASTLFKAVNTVLVEEEKKFADNIIYSVTDEDNELNKGVNKYFTPIEPLEYIIVPDEYGQPKLILCSKNTKKDDYVGAFGDSAVINDLREKTWSEVLKIYGFDEGGYTDTKLEEDDFGNNGSESSNFTGSVLPVWVNGNGDEIDYENMSRLDLLALSIGMEYILGESDKPFFYYGRWGAEEPFTADVPWEVPEHGDMEFTIELQGFETGRVMCWEIGTAKSLVGKYNFKGERKFLSDSDWDEILEYMGYTQGEYLEYDTQDERE